MSNVNNIYYNYFLEANNAMKNNKNHLALNYFLNILKNKNILNNTDNSDTSIIFSDIIYNSNIQSIKIIKELVAEEIKIETIPSDIFYYINECNVEYCVKNINKVFYNFNVYNNNITPLHKTIYNGDTNFLKCLLIMKGDIDIHDNNNNTLLEYACIQNDQTIIEFLIQHGADIHKHITLRKNEKCIYKSNEIDIALIELFIINKYLNIYNIHAYKHTNKYNYKYLAFVSKYINLDSNLEIDYKNVCKKLHLIIIIDILLDNMDISYSNEFVKIIKEELQYNLLIDLCCPSNKLYILLYNLLPFINYDTTISLSWLIHQDLKNTLLLSDFINKNIKDEFKNIVYQKYSNTAIKKKYLKILIQQYFYKLKI